MLSKVEFIEMIESFGFYRRPSANYDIFDYCGYGYRVMVYENSYDFHDGSKWNDNKDMNDLTPLKKITRSFKLKELLKND